MLATLFSLWNGMLAKNYCFHSGMGCQLYKYDSHAAKAAHWWLRSICSSLVLVVIRGSFFHKVLIIRTLLVHIRALNPHIM